MMLVGGHEPIINVHAHYGIVVRVGNDANQNYARPCEGLVRMLDQRH
jgi:hypothetical protein